MVKGANGVMVGKITVAPVSVCCERVAVMVVGRNSDANKFYKLKKKLSNNITLIVFTLLFAALIFVLYITNQKPVYTHKEAIYDEHSIHDQVDSKFSYGVIIDCGSSGSRVFICYWPPHTGRKAELLNIKQMIDVDGNPVRKKIKPGISSFANNPENASESLRTLLDFASLHVPRKKHQETPLYILATAGMRLLSKRKQNAIIGNLREKIPLMSNFHVTDSQVEVITGKQEGIYLWIATNYILNRFDHSHDAGVSAHHARKKTFGTIEIGGASLQIAYEVPLNQTVPQDLSATINLGCDMHDTIHEYKVYVTTHLGYGTDLARKRYVGKLYSENKEKFKNHETVIDPCLPTDMVDELTEGNSTFKLTGTGEFTRCKIVLQSILNESVPCGRPPCSLNGVFQPQIDFSHTEFYGFAEFWYSSNDVLRIGGKYRHKKLDTAAKDFCKTPWSLHKRHYAMGLYPKADAFRFKYQCFKSAWMTTVLHKGLRFPDGYKGLKTVQLINGKEVQWSLGALLYRTRFLPLRNMKVEDVLSTKVQQHGLWLIFHNGFYPIILFCIITIILMVIIYYNRINKYSRTIPIYRKMVDTEGTLPKESVYDLRIDL